jgi:hypothetical protein
MCLGTLGVLGVLFGGPGAMFVLGAPPVERESKTSQKLDSLSALETSALRVDLGHFIAPSDPNRSDDAGDQLSYPDCAGDSGHRREVEPGPFSGEGSLGESAKGTGVVIHIDADEVDLATDSEPSVPKDEATSGATTDSDATGSTSSSDGELYEPISTSRVTYPEGRPDWATMPRERHGKQLDRQVVSSGPYTRIQDCSEALDEELQKAANDYVDWQLDHNDAHLFVGVDLKYINEHLVQERAHYPVNSSVGPMQQTDALVEFDPSFRNEVNRRWDDTRGKTRLLLAGLFGGGAIGLLSLLFGFFRLDNATRGFYTGRLQFATVAAILGLVAAGVLLARWIPWL